MEGAIQLNIIQFSLVYLLLIVVVAIMKKSNIRKTKLLIISSFRMTVQLVLAGLILTYILSNPQPIFTLFYILIMIIFSIYYVLSKNKEINNRFKLIIAMSMFSTGLFMIIFFVMVIVGVDIFNPQYTIPLAGMIVGNSMTGVSLAIKVFKENISSGKVKIESLLNLGASPEKVLMPYVNNSLETALVPTINSMVGMGVVFLPGMMTGQILSGTLPLTSIMYQIAIMIAICASVCLAIFFSMYFGYKTLYNKRNQINYS
ncbi:MAG: ABC transporter permease [Methanobrevibacter sp.]|nr:ABC transporter permease [Methanobrevibacter sp.]